MVDRLISEPDRRRQRQKSFENFATTARYSVGFVTAFAFISATPSTTDGRDFINQAGFLITSMPEHDIRLTQSSQITHNSAAFIIDNALRVFCDGHMKIFKFVFRILKFPLLYRCAASSLRFCGCNDSRVLAAISWLIHFIVVSTEQRK